MIWNLKTCSLSAWGSEEVSWELTSYQTAADYTAALALDRSAVGIFRFVGDRKSYRNIQEDFARLYDCHLQIEYLGSMDDLGGSVQEAYNRDPDNTINWAPKCFAYWCTNGKAYLGDNLDNGKYPDVTPTNLESFLKLHCIDSLHKADQMLGFMERNFDELCTVSHKMGTSLMNAN